MLQAESAAKIFQEKPKWVLTTPKRFPRKGVHVYYRAKSPSSILQAEKLGSRFPNAGEEGKNACTDAVERTDKDETPILAVVLAASRAFANNAPRTGEEIEVHEALLREPEVCLAIGIANGVVFSPHEDIFGDADLHSNCTLEIRLGDGSGDNSVVDRGGDGGATVQVAGYAITRVETAVSEVQRGLVPVTVGDVHVDLALGSLTKTAGSEGGGGAPTRGGGAGHGVSGMSGKCENPAKRGAGMWQKPGRPEIWPRGARETSRGAKERIKRFWLQSHSANSVGALIPERVGDPLFRQAKWHPHWLNVASLLAFYTLSASIVSSSLLSAPTPPPSHRRTLVGGTPTRGTFVNNCILTSTHANGPSGLNSWMLCPPLPRGVSGAQHGCGRSGRRRMTAVAVHPASMSSVETGKMR
ncbi:hypothetical protein B0H16DRAFT_1486645 [Mycena metata]|uniref:Uncharacterized protein n=1 Tax=Mycena metata TaxID=1033252 RepID=A0AAD7DI13_9AGAR|nr:hypothetical protein B0H16DRAFT_1486645 [Mycena metata]